MEHNHDISEHVPSSHLKYILFRISNDYAIKVFRLFYDKTTEYMIEPAKLKR